jgi:aryl-alcohol dehydrogenase-like predicted oxidoreductase
MNQRKLGQTTLSVTPIGLGLAALGRPGYINLGHAQDLNENYDVGAMEAHAHAVLDAAWEAGVRYFDAARSYGKAEQFLSAWIAKRGLAPADLTVGSKWGYTYTADWRVDADVHEVKEHSLAVLQRQIKESREWLGQHLRLYQIHSATLSSGVLENQDVLAELTRLKQEGLYVGLTLSGARQAETLRRALGVRLLGGAPLFDTVQATWNLLEPAAGEVLQQAKNEGLGVIVKEALANGRLTPRNDETKLEPLRQIAAEKDTTIDAVALAAVLAQPWADVVLSGAATTDHVHSNVNALDVDWDEETAVRLQHLAEDPETYWDTRSDLDWN